TQQTNRLWNDTETTTNTFSNNRMQGWLYDASGAVTSAEGISYTRDAAGLAVHVDGESSHGTYGFDGEGRQVKTVLSHPGFHGITITTTTYYLNSTVLGNLAVAELNGSGQKNKRYLYAGARKLAEEAGGGVTWSHQEPLTGGRGDSTSSGSYLPMAEFNADGINVGFSAPVESGCEIPEPVIEGKLMARGSS